MSSNPFLKIGTMRFLIPAIEVMPTHVQPCISTLKDVDSNLFSELMREWTDRKFVRELILSEDKKLLLVKILFTSVSRFLLFFSLEH